MLARIRIVESIGLALRVFLAFLAVIALGAGVSFADGLPPDAKKVVEAFEKETAGIRQKGNDRASAAQDKLLKKLRELQVEQTKAGMLDEAVLIRVRVRAVEADKKAGRLPSMFTAGDVTKLPEDAQVAVREYEEAIGEASKVVEKDLQDKQTEYNAKLKELLATYTKEGKLDEALAIRSRISSNPTEVTTTTPPAANIDIGGAGTDYAVAERRFQEQIGLSVSANEKAHRLIVDTLIKKLGPVLTAHTKAGRLDAAVAIRNLIQKLTPGQSPQQLLQHCKKDRDQLSADAVQLVDEFLKEAGELQKGLTEKLAKLNAAFAPHVEVEARKQLLAGKLEPARQLLTQVYRNRNQDFPFSWAGHYRSTPTLSEKAQPIFDRFVAGKTERLAKTNATLEPLRKKWVASLQAALDAKPKDEDMATALEQTIEVLGVEGAEGMEWLLVFVADTRLPPASLADWKELRTTVKKLYEELKTATADSAKQLAAELAPIRDAHIAAGEYDAAFIILERQLSVHPPLAPLVVKVSPAHGHPFAWDGTVIDVKDGQFLVHYMHRDEWLPRNRFRVGNESPAVSKQLGGEPNQAFATPRPGFGVPKDGPGKPVTEKTKLKVGQKLVAYWGSSWLPVTVVAVGVAGPKIHWEGYSNNFDEVIDRTRLREVSED